jgi:hypothetical protein
MHKKRNPVSGIPFFSSNYKLTQQASSPAVLIVIHSILVSSQLMLSAGNVCGGPCRSGALSRSGALEYA